MRSLLYVSRLVLALAGLVLAHAALAQSYQPLEIGNYWVYQGAVVGEHERQTVVGTIHIWDVDVYVIRYTESTHNEGLENYWTVDEDGDVLLWGGRWSDGWGVLYLPPIRQVDAPLWLGKTWVTDTNLYSTPDTTLMGHWTINFGATTEETLLLPAGTFHAFGTGEVAPAPIPALKDHDLKGEYAPSRPSRTPTDWWADGTGEVQYSTSDLYQLVEYGNVPTALRMSSWGRIKALYGH